VQDELNLTSLITNVGVISVPTWGTRYVLENHPSAPEIMQEKALLLGISEAAEKN